LTHIIEEGSTVHFLVEEQVDKSISVGHGLRFLRFLRVLGLLRFLRVLRVLGLLRALGLLRVQGCLSS
jgi:hypothetical protein